MYALTREGEEYLKNGLPEVRLVKEVLSGRTSMKELQRLPYFTIGLMWAKKNGWVTVSGGEIRAEAGAKSVKSDIEAVLADVERGREVSAKLAEPLLSRKLVEERRESPIINDGEILQLTPDIIRSGAWERVPFKRYDVSLRMPEISYGRKHVLRMAIDRISRVLVEMGFKEMEGPIADAEFYVYDCLFTPQDHPARTAWDQFSLSKPKTIRKLPADVVRRVKAAHEHGGGTGSKGWGYSWDKDIAMRMMLRGHTTSVTARYLLEHNSPPNRYFSIDKIFRNDSLDKTHLLEFYQIEGWVMDGHLTVRDLMGTFGEFYRKLGIRDIKFKPTYNPYTEPSFEIYGRHPKLGRWLEIGNSGMFRDEMLRALGVKSDVMAWGLGLERTIMLLNNYDDIRNLHGTLCDLDFLREVPIVWEY